VLSTILRLHITVLRELLQVRGVGGFYGGGRAHGVSALVLSMEENGAYPSYTRPPPA